MEIKCSFSDIVDLPIMTIYVLKLVPIKHKSICFSGNIAMEQTYLDMNPFILGILLAMIDVV